MAEIKKFHETFYRSNNAYLILSGDITQKEAEPLVKRAAGMAIARAVRRSYVPPAIRGPLERSGCP